MSDDLRPGPARIPPGEDTAQPAPAANGAVPTRPAEEPMAELVRQYVEFQRLQATMDMPTVVKVGERSCPVTSRPPGYSRLIWREFYAMAGLFDETNTEDLIAARKVTAFLGLLQGDGDLTQEHEQRAREIATIVRAAQVGAGDKYAGERLECLVRIVQLILERPKQLNGLWAAPDFERMDVSADEVRWGMTTEEITKALDAWYMRDVVLQRNREKKILRLVA